MLGLAALLFPLALMVFALGIEKLESVLTRSKTADEVREILTVVEATAASPKEDLDARSA